jgi:hypothetical protein
MRRVALLLTMAAWAVALGTAPASAGSASGGASAWGDFDADGFVDLAIAAPGEDVGGKQRAGGVHVLYGGSRALSSRSAQFVSQARRGVAGEPEPRTGWVHAGERGSRPRRCARPGGRVTGRGIGRSGVRLLRLPGRVRPSGEPALGPGPAERPGQRRGRRGLRLGMAFGRFGRGSVGDLAIGGLNADVA